MKKVITISAGILLILFLTAGCTPADDVFHVEFVEGEAYNGFLFKLDEEADLTEMPDYIEEGVFREIIPEIGLYYSDTIDAVKARFSSDDVVYIEPNYTMNITD